MSAPNCDRNACNACMSGMYLTSQTVCTGGEEAVDAMCEWAIENVGENLIAGAFAAAGCGTAAGIACESGFEVNWSDKACAALFGNDGCCGEPPDTEGSCGTCPYDCTQLAKVFPLVYNDQLPQAMIAC